MRLSDLAPVAGLTVVRDGAFAHVGSLSNTRPDLLVVLYDRGYLPQLLANPAVACVITTADTGRQLPEQYALAVSPDPLAAFYAVHDYLARHTAFYWQDFETTIAADAVIHPRAHVAPRSVRIGAGTVIEANAVIHERALLGSRVVVRAGAVIAGEGFEPKFVGGRHIIVTQAGGVQLEDNVEIQSNAHLQRAVYGGATRVGAGTKVGALVHIGSNASLGQDCEVAPGVVIGGSARIGDRVWIGPNATISNEIRVGDGAFITLGAVVTREVPAQARVSGNFAIAHDRFLQFIKRIR